MKPLVVIQARVSSKRLPAKVLLPVAGVPLAVVCARRAANRGLPVCVATSEEPSDDVLFGLLQAFRVNCIRGPLDDVLKRFVMATASLDDMAPVVRLTADNVLPDGDFIERMLEHFRPDQGYLGTQSPFDGLPYGMSAEIFTAALLREADSVATAAADREHVTPWIRRKTSTSLFRSPLAADLSHVRVTIDELQDYQRILRAFRPDDDPVTLGWQTMCERVAADFPSKFRVPYRLKRGRALSRMTLGTAAIGLERYGIANTTGQPDKAEASALIRQAVWHGVTEVDTAAAYGSGETRVGDSLAGLPAGLARVITKLDPLPTLNETASDDQVQAAVERSLYASCHALRTRRLDVFLLHRSAHRRSHGGRVWSVLLEARRRGLVDELGVSTSSPQETLDALQDPDVLHIQLPFNLLDRRWQRAGVPEALQRRPEVTVYARSAFLQGALLLPPSLWPRPAQSHAAAWCAELDRLVTELGRLNRADLCLAYCLAQTWVDSVVLGLETAEQLREGLDVMRRPPLQPSEAIAVEAAFPDIPETVLNPSMWGTQQ